MLFLTLNTLDSIHNWQSFGVEFPPRAENDVPLFTPPQTQPIIHRPDPSTYEAAAVEASLQSNDSALRWVLHPVYYFLIWVFKSIFANIFSSCFERGWEKKGEGKKGIKKQNRWWEVGTEHQGLVSAFHITNACPWLYDVTWPDLRVQKLRWFVCCLGIWNST